MTRLVMLIYTRKMRWPAAAVIVLLLTVALFRLGLTSSIPDTSPGHLAGRRVAIDPGHGGIDGGTNCPGFLEKDVNLAVALKLKEELTSQGALATLTREEDIDLGMMTPEDGDGRYLRGLKTRVSIIDRSQSDLFLSIHVNSNGRSPAASGPMVFYSKNTTSSSILAESIQSSLNTFVEEKGLRRHNPETARYFLLERCKTAGVIVETGFMTNQRERELLKREDYQRELVLAIIKGLKDYYTRVETAE